MKRIVFIFLVLVSSFVNGQVTRADLDEPNPHRGLYINNFFVLDPGSWNSLTPPYTIAPNVGILGTDINHDGIFEKERELLEYCRDNHITFIILLNLHQLFGSEVKLWDENQGRSVPIEDHLCRFMNDARNNYCIDQIGAAADNSNTFQVYSNSISIFSNKTAPIVLSASQRNSYASNPDLLLMEDATLQAPDPKFYQSECLKFYYRAANFTGTSECGTFFNYLHMEYEYWRNSPDDYTSYSESCTLNGTNTISTASTTDIEIGSIVSGFLIPSNTVITAKTANSFTVTTVPPSIPNPEILNFTFVIDGTANSVCCNSINTSITCHTVIGTNVVTTSNTSGIEVSNLFSESNLGTVLYPNTSVASVGVGSFTMDQPALATYTGTFTVTSTAQRVSTNSCATTIGNHRWDSYSTAKYYTHFKPTIKAMHLIAYNYNLSHNYTSVDPQFMRTDAYLEDIGDNSSQSRIDLLNDFITLIDGAAANRVPGVPIPNCLLLRPTYPVNYDGDAGFEARVNRLCRHAFVPFAWRNPPVWTDFSMFYSNVSDLNGNSGIPPNYYTNWETDVHPIFSSERISDGGYDDYWGKWFDLSSLNNIFESEKLFYRNWRNNGNFFSYQSI